MARTLSRAALVAALVAGAGFSPSIRANCASPIDAYYYFVHWISAGRPDLALEQFAEDAVVIAGPWCTPSSPCVGRDDIRRWYFSALRGGHAHLPLTDQRFDGQVLRTHGEVIALEGGVQLHGGHVFEFRAGCISSLRANFQAIGAPLLEATAADQSGK
jgi:hypothetical protein